MGICQPRTRKGRPGQTTRDYHGSWIVRAGARQGTSRCYLGRTLWYGADRTIEAVRVAVQLSSAAREPARICTRQLGDPSKQRLRLQRLRLQTVVAQRRRQPPTGRRKCGGPSRPSTCDTGAVGECSGRLQAGQSSPPAPYSAAFDHPMFLCSVSRDRPRRAGDNSAHAASPGLVIS